MGKGGHPIPTGHSGRAVLQVGNFVSEPMHLRRDSKHAPRVEYKG